MQPLGGRAAQARVKTSKTIQTSKPIRQGAGKNQESKKQAGTLDTGYKDKLPLREGNTWTEYTMEGRITRPK